MTTVRCVARSAPRPPAWASARLFASLAAAAGLAAPSWAAGPRSAPPSPACHLEPFASGTVEAVVDGRTFALADGREVRLDGIEIQPGLAGSSPAGGESPKADVAAAALAALVAGKEVVLTHAKAATDRHGRVLADAVLAPQSGPASVTKTLVEQGVVRVAGRSAGAGACLPELRSAERSARSARLGLWGDPRYFPRTAEDVGTLSAEHGRFTLVEGMVVSVRESGGTIYVNFGQRWSEDFTVTILKRNERLFTAAGLEPRKLAGRRVMVRGWLEERGGPWIEAAGPDQIEVVAEK